MPTVKEMAAQLDQQDKESKDQAKAKIYSGHADVLEGSVVRLMTSFKGQKAPEGKAEWIIQNGATGAEEKIACELGGKPTVVTLPDVPADKAKYDYTYKLSYGGKERAGACDFTVWPTELEVKTKYKNGTGETHPTLKDGDAVKGFQFHVVQGEDRGREWKTGDDGTLKVTLTKPEACFVEPASPWSIISPTDQKDAVRVREFEVNVKPWKAKVRSHAGKDEKSPLKVYVNEKAKASCLKVEVGPEDLTLAKKDQIVKVRATFPAKNTKRNDPFPAIQTTAAAGSKLTPKKNDAKPGVDDLVYETDVKIPVDGQPAVFYLELGLAGGDKCKLEVGVTDKLEDDVVHFQNWRKLILELLMPKKAERQACPKLLDDADPKLGADLKKCVEKAFEETYIEFADSPDASKNFETANVEWMLKGKGPDAGFDIVAVPKPGNLYVPAAKFCDPKIENGALKITNEVLEGRALGGGTTVFLCSDYQRRYLRHSLASGIPKPKNSLTWVWMDMITGRSKTNPTGTGNKDKWDEKLDKLWNFFNTSFQGKDEKKYITPFHVFDKDPMQADDVRSFKRALWLATRYRKKGGGDGDWKDIKTVPAECDCPACVSLKAKSKPLKHTPPRANPGSAYTAVKTVNFADDTAVGKWVSITNSRNVVMKLPKKNDLVNPWPGDVVVLKVMEDHLKAGGETKDDTEQKEVEYELDITVQLECYGIEFGVLGGAVSGEGDLRTSCGLAPPEGMCNTLAHEIAHNCGATYMGKVGTITGGCTTKIPGYEFELGVPDGPYYVAHGHQGSHCIKVLFDKLGTADDKKKALFKETDLGPEIDYGSLSDDLKTKYWSKIDATKDHCIMFGEGDPDTTTLLSFCEKCKEYLRANDLTDVTKAW
jgi:hypothetical protein